MIKNSITIFFACIFLAFLTAPSLIIMIDKEVDYVALFNFAEEEIEAEENELRELFELDVCNNYGNSGGLISQVNLKFNNFNKNSYYNPVLNSTYRPPEQL